MFIRTFFLSEKDNISLLVFNADSWLTPSKCVKSVMSPPEMLKINMKVNRRLSIDPIYFNSGLMSTCELTKYMCQLHSHQPAAS